MPKYNLLIWFFFNFKAKGEGGGKIFIPNDAQNSDPAIVLNSGEIFATASQLKNKEKWILGGIGLAFVALFVIIISVFKSKKKTRKTTSNSNKQSKSSSPNKIKTLNRNGEPSNNKENLMNINSNNLDNDDMDEAESIYQKHSLYESILSI